MKVDFKMDHDGKLCQVLIMPCNLAEAMRKREEKEPHDLPPNWRTLNWHRLVQNPCLWGDDVFVAYDAKLKKAYAIFDGWTNHYDWPFSFESFAMQNAIDPELLDNVRSEQC
jgi:hypothetical protein